MVDRPDLAAMIVPLGRALVEAELPVLREHDLAMWGYVVLLGLGEQPTRSQSALAQSIGADKTRIIGVLDNLQQRGLILREPDPADRRAHTVTLTPKGRSVRDRAQTAIQANEDRLLANLSASDRRGFLRALRALAAMAD